MVELLLKHGADPLIKLRSGLHPLEVVNMNTENGIKDGDLRNFLGCVNSGVNSGNST